MVSNCPQQKDAVAASLVTQTNLTPSEKINKSRQKMNYVSWPKEKNEFSVTVNKSHQDQRRRELLQTH